MAGVADDPVEEAQDILRYKPFSCPKNPVHLTERIPEIFSAMLAGFDFGNGGHHVMVPFKLVYPAGRSAIRSSV